MSKISQYNMQVDRIDYADEIRETHITVPNIYDKNIEKILNRKDIPYTYFNAEQPVNRKEILSRISIDEMDKTFGYELREINVIALDKVLRNNTSSYVGYKGQGGSKEKYERFKRFLHTNHQIRPPKIGLYKDINDQLRIVINDGRHRFAVLRDIGMTSIPVAIDQKSLKLGKEIGLFK